MGRSKKKEPTPFPQVQLQIESIDLEGNGVAHLDGKVHFVEGGLTGETVVAEVVKSKPSYAKARTVKVLKAS
ncbi:MAG TPA: TRAM domain-containing protein, partial [Limnobacter sp.]|nr:TRAM domain-containing protein [Limnobacter sp.]